MIEPTCPYCSGHMNDGYHPVVARASAPNEVKIRYRCNRHKAPVSDEPLRNHPHPPERQENDRPDEREDDDGP